MSAMHPVVAGYLAKLRDTSGHLPVGQRDELLARVGAQIQQAHENKAISSEHLEQMSRDLGPAHPAPAAAIPTKPTREILALVLMAASLLGLLGSWLAALVGLAAWITGVVLVCTSRLWLRRDQYLTLGLFGGVTGLPWALLVVAVLGTWLSPNTTADGAKTVLAAIAGAIPDGLHGWVWVVLPAVLAGYLGVMGVWLVRRAQGNHALVR